MAQPDTKPQAPAAAPDALVVQRRPDGGADAALNTERSVAAPSPLADGGRDAQSRGAALQLDPLVPQLILWTAACLLLLSVRRAYARSTRPLTRTRRVVLACLRAGAAAAIVFCLARPVLVQQRQLREQALAFIAVDSSASMDLRDAPGGRTRWQAAGDILGTHRKVLERLGSEFELHRWVFDSTVRATPVLPGEPSAPQPGKDEQAGELAPRGVTTDLAALLEKLGAEGGGGTGAGAIIISDGRHNASRDVIPAALALQRAGVPLYCIGVGQEATPTAYKDVRIRDLVVPEKAFVGSRMVLRVEIESTLPVPVTVPLTVLVAGKKVHESSVSLPQGANMPAPAVEIPYVPEALGVHRVVASLGAVEGEADVSNNARSAFFRVYRSKLGIWYVEGAIRKEFGAIRSALETAPNVQLKALNAFMVRTSTKEELLPVKPEEREQLRLVIIGDLPASRFDRAALQHLAKFVEDGGAVLMIGGASSFGSGDWQHSPLAPVLPVELTASDGVHNGALRITVAPDEAAHSVLAIGDTPAQSAELWQLLPPLPGINRIANTRPAAHVLLRAGMDELLVVQEYGKGRSAVFTGDTTWQWALKANQGETQKRFWRNLAVWLTRSDYRDTEKAVFADSERLQYQAGEEVLLRAYAHETEKIGATLKQASITIALTRFQGDKEVPILKEEIGMGPGEYEKRLTPSLPGSYRFRVSAVAFGGHVIGTDSVDIQVTAPDVEHDNPKANLSLLRRIASLSGGMYYDPEHAAEAFQALLRRQAGYTKTVTDVRELWNQPWLLGVFIGLLTLEWALRKRWGLI